MKERYQINLDKESVEALDRWLEAAGLTRSAFINTYIVKVVEAMDLKKIPDYSKMSATQLFKMFGNLGKLMNVKEK
jgi:hypothetical protein